MDKVVAEPSNVNVLDLEELSGDGDSGGGNNGSGASVVTRGGILNAMGYHLRRDSFAKQPDASHNNVKAAMLTLSMLPPPPLSPSSPFPSSTVGPHEEGPNVSSSAQTRPATPLSDDDYSVKPSIIPISMSV